MATIKVYLDDEVFERLTESAVSELRPISWHAEVLIRRALGVHFPYPQEEPPATPCPNKEPDSNEA
jgi:hypothetical protein